jgi:predicted Zn finger-like uncharacterized protein
MSIRVTCPSCESTFAVNDDLAGKKVRCRECKEPVPVRSAAKAEKPGGGKKSEAVSARAPAVSAAKGRSRKRVEDEEDDNEDDDRPKGKVRKRDQDDDDNDNDDVRPKGKSRRRDDDDRPKRKSAAKQSSMMSPLLLGGGVLALLVLVAGGVGAIFVFKGQAAPKDNPPLAQGANGDKDKPPIVQPDKPPPVVDPKPDDRAAKKDKNDENPFKPAGDNPLKPVAGNPNLITPDWSGARAITMVPGGAGWNLKVNPAAELAYKPMPVGLPQRRHVFEGCNAFIVNPIARRAIVGYGWNDKGKTTSRMLYCDVENGQIVSHFVADGDVKPIAISDDGTQGLFRRDAKGKNMLELWSLSDKGGTRVMEFKPAKAGEPEQEIRLAVFLDAKRLLTASYQGKVVLWDMPAVKPIYHATISGSCVPALSPDRRLLAFVLGEQVGVLDVDTGKVAAMQPTPPGMPWPTLSFSPGGKWISCLVLDRVVIWNAATGALYREVPTEGNLWGNAPWVSDKHLLLGNNRLADIDMPYTFWEYNGANQVQVANGVTWFVTHDGNQGVILTAVLPHPPALLGYGKGVKELALKPGTVVKIDVSALPDKAEAAKVAKTLEEKLAKIGCSAGPAGTLELVAYADVGKEVKMSFTPIVPKKKGPGKTPPPPPDKVQTVSIQEHFARLKFVWQGKELWQLAGDNIPQQVQLLEGETLAEHMKKLERPNYAFYQTVNLPRMLMQTGGPTIVGKTNVTISGVR